MSHAFKGASLIELNTVVTFLQKQLYIKLKCIMSCFIECMPRTIIKGSVCYNNETNIAIIAEN